MSMSLNIAAARRRRGFDWRPYTWFAAAIVAAIIPAALLHDSYLMETCASIVIFSIVLVGLDLVIGYGELLAFSHGAFFALGAYVMGVLSARYGVPLLAGAAFAILANAALAVLIGAATLRLQGYYLAVATLGFGIIMTEMLGTFVDVTGGWSGLRGMAPLVLFHHHVTEDVEFYAIGAALLIIGIAIGRNVINSRFGRAVRASGNDALAAEVLGVPTSQVRLKLFVIGAIYASVAGSLYAAFLRVVTPANFDVVTSINMVLMLFLGGKETLWGPVLGATILRVLPEVAEGLNDYKTLIQGVLFVAVLMFFPSGITGFLLLQFKRIGRIAKNTEAAGIRNPGANVGADVVEPHAFGGSPVVPCSQQATETILRVTGLSKAFGGVAALDDVSFGLRAGQLKAVIGPNGAGKTTLFNLLTGVLQPNAGSIELQGRLLFISRPHRIVRQGVARTFQTPRLFANMTVLENVLVGEHMRLRSNLANSILQTRSTRKEEEVAARHAEHLLERLGIAHLAFADTESLSFGQRRLLEMARCLAMQPRILLLDEPAAGLNDTEKAEFSRLLLALRSEGITLLLVEHDMRLVMSITDEILVLDHGRKIAEGSPEQIKRDNAVLEAYLGAEVSDA
jgi:branched-chain amino acid transport system permease protein